MLIQVGVAFRSTKQSVYSAVFECSCGKRKVMIVGRVKRGTAKSCGNCNRSGATFKKRSRAEIAWMNMVSRCCNQSNPDYKNYGARGITVDRSWRKFAIFLSDMGEPPKGMTLERINNSQGYCAENCRWASMRDQARNRRNNIHVVVMGRTTTIAEAAEILGVNRRCVRKHLRAS